MANRKRLPNEFEYYYNSGLGCIPTAGALVMIAIFIAFLFLWNSFSH